MRVRAMAMLVTKVLRDAWLVVGLALLLVIGLESCYRIQGAVRQLLRREPRLTAQEAREEWFPTLLAETRASNRLRWEPYVYLRTVPFEGTYVNVDSAGHRRTVPAAPRSDVAPRVFFFGGSTMVGTFQRDAETIPSTVARQLADRWDIAADVTNLGVSGFTFTTEVIALLRHLQQGDVPDVAVFYDGINDVAASVQNGVAGVPQNEFNRARDFELGRTVFSWKSDLWSEARVLGSVAAVTAGRLQFLQRLRRAVGGAERAEIPSDSVLAADLAAVYGNTALAAASMAREFGVEVLFYWQPTLHTTEKPLTRNEAALLEVMSSDPYHQSVINVHRALAGTLASSLPRGVRGRFKSLDTLFRADSAPMFADVIGHTYERANTPIARVVAADIADILARRAAPPDGAHGRP